MDIGIQPWQMPVSGSYRKVYQLGFRGVPDRPLPDYIANSVGLPPQPIQYETPDYSSPDDYYVLAPRGLTSFIETFKEFCRKSSLPVFVIGAKGDYIGEGIDMTGVDFLQTANYIKHSKGFVGLMSSQLVLANGYNVNKVIVHDGRSWDMRHIVHSPYSHYLVNPSVNEILERLKND